MAPPSRGEQHRFDRQAPRHRIAVAPRLPEHGEPMPRETTDDLQRQIDAVPLAFESNLKAFREAFGSFLETLRKMTLTGLRERSTAAYRAWPSCSAHVLGY